MNLTLRESALLAQQFRAIKPVKPAELAICPSFIALEAVVKALKGSAIKLGAQNCAVKESGALTGEVSARSLKALGCQYVILGHSERRQILGEGMATVGQKAALVLAAGLTPVICVGESFRERQKGETVKIIARQLAEALKTIKKLPARRILIAYEPVWAISTAGRRPATGVEAEAVCRQIQKMLVKIFGPKAAAKHFQIIYGGTVNGQNIKEFAGSAVISGFLVGAASLTVKAWRALVNNI